MPFHSSFASLPSHMSRPNSGQFSPTHPYNMSRSTPHLPQSTTLHSTLVPNYSAIPIPSSSRLTLYPGHAPVARYSQPQPSGTRLSPHHEARSYAGHSAKRTSISGLPNLSPQPVMDTHMVPRHVIPSQASFSTSSSDNIHLSQSPSPSIHISHSPSPSELPARKKKKMRGRTSVVGATPVWNQILTNAQDMVTEAFYRKKNGSWGDILFQDTLQRISRENLTESHHEWVTKMLPNNDSRPAPEPR